MERVLYIKQEKITIIIYFFVVVVVHFNSTFTSLTAPQDSQLFYWLCTRQSHALELLLPSLCAGGIVYPRWQHWGKNMALWLQEPLFQDTEAHLASPGRTAGSLGLIKRSLLEWLCPVVYRYLIKIWNIPKSWFLMLQNRWHFPHLIVLMLKVDLASEKGNIQHPALTCTTLPGEQGQGVPTSLNKLQTI